MDLATYKPDRKQIKLPEHLNSERVRAAFFMLVDKVARGSTYSILEELVKYLKRLVH